MNTSGASSLDLPEDVGISTFLLYLFNKNLYTDIHITVKNGNHESTFSAHKMVLAMWSPYFAKEFYGPVEKVNNLIKLLDIDPHAFGDVLKYMYSSKIKIENPKNACAIYKVAKKFDIGNLMKECQKTLNKIEIHPENALDMLEAADVMQNNSTKDRCVKVIQEKIEEVSKSYKLPNISASVMHVLIDSLNLHGGFNLELFLFIFAWAKNQYVEDDKCPCTREALKEFLPKLPFLCLSNVEFAELNKQFYQILEPDEIISIFMNIAIPGSKIMPDFKGPSSE